MEYSTIGMGCSAPQNLDRSDKQDTLFKSRSAEYKTKVVLEIISGTKSAAEICREHNLKPYLLSHWKKQFLANVSKVFENGKYVWKNWRSWQVSKA